MKKRQFIKGGLGASAVLLAGSGLVNPFSRKFPAAEGQSSKRELPIPKLLESIDETPLSLSMSTGKWEMLRGISTSTIGFNGPCLGPTLRVRNGEDVPLTYKNNLSESVAIHAHGLHVPGQLDGGPQQEINPGEEWSVELPIRQQACTSWYHPHTHGRTGPQTYQGLAGFIIIDDENSDSLPLPKTYGVDDLPLVIQDRSFDSQGQLFYSIDDPEDGMMAESITVNGIANPQRTVPAGLVRLRLLNGSNARYYRFYFSDNRIFHSIATDGGFLNEPVPIREIVLLPGERNEIVVDFSDGNSVQLLSGPALTARADPERRNRDSRNRRNDWEPGGLNDSLEILDFHVNRRLAAFQTPLPRQTNSINRPTLRRDIATRQFELYMEGGDRRRGFFSEQRSGSEMAMGINGKPMNMNVINERVNRGQWERWTIRSNDGSHPFHVHGCSFLVLSQDGRPVADEYAGWKDTVRVDDSAEFIVRFDHEATDEFPYMYHCHILEHEDKGMMGQFTVT